MKPDEWLFCIVACQAAISGGVVLRAARDVERSAGRVVFEAELRRRGYHTVENAGQFVILCNNAPIRQIC